MGVRERITSPYTIYCGQNSCAYLHSDSGKVIEWIAQKVYHQERGPERRLQLGDCSNPFGQCAGHPVGTHGPGTVRAFDMNYYLTVPGASQYRSGVISDPASQYVNIWTAPDVLDTAKINWQANFLFWSEIHRIFPKAHIIASTKIVRYVKSKVTQAQASEMFFYVTEDDTTTYLHHTHAHIDLGNQIQWT